MTAREVLHVNPALLHLPGSQRDGADPIKLQRQLARYGTSVAGMPPLEVKRGWRRSKYHRRMQAREVLLGSTFRALLSPIDPRT